MSVKDNWLKNLRAIVYELGPGAGRTLREGYRAVASATGLGEEYIYQLYNGKGAKSLSAESATTISRAYGDGKPRGWFDVDQTHPVAINPIAHPLSLNGPQNGAPIQWGGLQKMPVEELPDWFMVEMPDDSLFPRKVKGVRMMFERVKAGQSAKPGNTVFVQDKRGARYIRRYVAGHDGEWTAKAENDAYASLESKPDELTILAISRYSQDD